MNLEGLALDAIKTALVLGAALGLALLLRRRAASLRRLVLGAGFAAALALPFATRLAPAIGASRPVIPAAVARPFAEPPTDATATPRATVRTEGGGAAVSIELVRPAEALFALWALVAAALVAGVLRSQLAARGLAARADRELDPAWQKILVERMSSRKDGLEIRISEELDTPAVVGVFARIVLVPATSRGWTAGRRRAVLDHELAHVDARDGLVRLVGRLVCALHWFDPLAWIALAALRRHQEAAADEAALHAGATPSSYAADLVEIARSARPAPAAVIGMATPSELETRVRAIVARVRPAPASTVLAASAVLGLIGTTSVLACARPAAGESGGGSPAVGSSAPAAAPPRGADPKLQAIVDDEIERLVRDASPERAAVIVLEPSSGRVLAEAGRDHGAAADIAFGSTFVPGSTFKVVVISAALEQKSISKESRFDCAPRDYAGREIHDASPNGTLSLGEAVAVSSNVAVTRILDGIGGERFLATARRLHFGERPAGASNAATGLLPGAVDPATFDGAMNAIGEGVPATPAQIAAAYAAVAAGGVYHAPTRGGASPGERVLAAETAATMLDLLDGAVNGEHATGANARVDGVRVAGKTGTADVVRGGAPHTYASFVGVAPREAPRFVILVSAEIAAPPEKATGGQVAAPVFARILRRAL